MTKRPKMTKLIVSSSLGVLLTVLHLGGALINTVTSNVAIGGGINSLLTSALVVLCALIIDKFWAISIMMFVYGATAIPFNLVGTPGLAIKIPIATVGGLLVDILYKLLKRKKILSALLIGGPLQIYLGLILVVAADYFKFSGFEMVAGSALIVLIVGSMAVGAIGGYLGWLVYQKIKDSSVVKRIKEKNEK